MIRIALAALVLGTLAACTFVNERPSRQPEYVQGATQPPLVQRDSYEAERQAYEYGRRDGAAGRGW